jgi:hypothetical protein
MLQTTVPIPEPNIRRAVAESFHRGTLSRITLWDRFIAWVAELWIRFWTAVFRGTEAVGMSKPVSILILILLGLAVVAVIARAIWLWRTSTMVGRPAGALPGGFFRTPDPWARAQALAAAGDHTAAAHALYAALLEAAARGQQVRLHPSKTVGDYSRELRSRGSRLSPRFREFAGDYEVVIYGDQTCDADRYDRLFALAVPMLRTDG